MAKRRHTELECFILGLLWRHGPCTPYAIRRMLLDSPSTQWSGSAGAIYPLLRRLERDRLVGSKSHQKGLRQGRAYAITRKGSAVLRAWIGPPLPEEAVTVVYDPLRSRVRFLDAVPPAERLAWIEASERALDAVEERIGRWQELYGSVSSAQAPLLTRHGEMDIRMRRAWLKEVKAAVGKGRESEK